MDKMRQMGLLALVAVVVVAAGGWFLLISPQRSKVSTLHAQTADQQQKNMQLTTEISRLKAEARDLPAEQARLAAIAEQLPPNPAMPALVNDLVKAAKTSGVDLQIITPQTPMAFGSGTSAQLAGITQPQAATSTTTSTSKSAGSAASSSTGSSTSSSSSGSTSSSSSGSTSSTSGSSTSSSTGTASGASTTSGATSGSTTLASGTASTTALYQLPMSVTVVGTYYQITQFVHQIENLHRAFLVTELDFQPGDPLAKQSTADVGGVAGANGPDYTGALTAQVDGFVFEVLTQAPTTGTATLPSTASGH